MPQFFAQYPNLELALACNERHFDLVAEGIDCALWIAAYSNVAPQWKTTIPVIALTGAQVHFRSQPRVAIEVGRPGVDHDGVEYVSFAGALAWAAARKASQIPSVARILVDIATALPQAGE